MRHPAIYAAITAIVTCAVTAALCIAIMVRYTDNAREKAIQVADENTHRSQQVWCAVVVTIDNAYHSDPSVKPTTEIGQMMANEFSKLRQSLGC